MATTVSPDKKRGLHVPLLPRFPYWKNVPERDVENLKRATGPVGDLPKRTRGLGERVLIALCVAVALWNAVHSLYTSLNRVYEPVLHGSSMAAMAAAVGVYWTHRGDGAMYCLSLLVMLMLFGVGSATLVWELSDLSLGVSLPDTQAHLGFPAARTIVYSGGGAAQAQSAMQSRFGQMVVLFMLGTVLVVYAMAYAVSTAVHACRADAKVGGASEPAVKKEEENDESGLTAWANDEFLERWFPEVGEDDVYMCCVPTDGSASGVGERFVSAGVMHWVVAVLSWCVLACVAAAGIQFLQRRDAARAVGAGFHSTWLVFDTYAVPVAMVAGARAFSRPSAAEGPWTLLASLALLGVGALAHIVVFIAQAEFFNNTIGCDFFATSCIQGSYTTPFSYGAASITNAAPPGGYAVGAPTVSALSLDTALFSFGAALYLVLMLQIIFTLVVQGANSGGGKKGA